MVFLKPWEDHPKLRGLFQVFGLVVFGSDKGHQSFANVTWGLSFDQRHDANQHQLTDHGFFTVARFQLAGQWNTEEVGYDGTVERRQQSSRHTATNLARIIQCAQHLH